MNDKESMEMSGTILYLKDHTSETKKLRYTIIMAFVVLACFLLWISLTNRIAYPIGVIRQNTAALNEYNAIQGRCQVWKDMMQVQTENLEQCRDFNKEYVEYFDRRK